MSEVTSKGLEALRSQDSDEVVEFSLTKAQKEESIIRSPEGVLPDNDFEIDSRSDSDTVEVTIKKLKGMIGSSVSGIYDASSSSSSSSDEDDEEKQPAWIDENDVLTTQEGFNLQGKKRKLGSKAGEELKRTLEEKYKSIMGVQKWAKRKRKQNENDIDLLANTGSLVTESKLLKKDKIEFQRLNHLNQQTFAEGRLIKSVLFHPSSTVGLVAGLSGVVSLFQVDGKENTKLQSIEYRNYPISCASFLRNGEEFMIGSRDHNYFYSHDLISGQSCEVRNASVDITNFKKFAITPDGRFIVILGRFGEMFFLSSKSKEYVCTLQMNGKVSSVSFHEDKMYSHGSDGEVYIWDLKTRRCVHKFIDDGCIDGTALATSPNGKLIACGSSTGVVNIYDANKVAHDRAPTPLKTIYNLVTEVHTMKFNSTSEILAFASHYKDSAIKMLHCRSMTVFSNFPNPQSKLKQIHCLDLSPNSGYMAIGDNNSNASLFRLKYYGNY